ncbi:TerB family tellurite resistance protein [Loktanella sp. SALINAS62]|uniref:tellurite resistance TerB family protein n=1 Tax=Loktanella sp. SALINAS62 TaxID=2706124 RepID=UPI001B8C5C10|nr:TerB family tellurite resistance protein [Loktanella sp. SALINAS62]MBS1303925.1 TerB family tellurite resistance protein [Loktanella sp. SALINAS62]
MFADLIARLTATDPAPASDADARLALGALLVRLARADDDYAAIEQVRIKTILERRYGLSDGTALLAECEALEQEAPDTVRFTRAIKDAVPYEDRLSVIEAMWDIVLADGHRDDDENSLMRMVAPMLGVADQDSNAARRRIEARQ